MMRPAPPEANAECPLCGPRARQVTVRLSEQELLALAKEYSARNQAELAAIDAALQAGRLGPPRSRAAQRRARRLARLALTNLYALLFRLAADPLRVYELDPRGLERLTAEVADPSLFTAIGLQSLRLGGGHACARYDLSRSAAGLTSMGGRPSHYSVGDVRIDGRPRRVLSLEIPTTSVGRAEALFSDHYRFRVALSHSEGPPMPYDLYLVHDLEGGWLRRWGIHRPTAFAFWVSSADSMRADPIREPLVGICVYIPGLRLELPSLLPDINLDDIRTLELPMPLLPVTQLRGGQLPGWMPVGAHLDFSDWNGVGGVPPGVRQLLPDR